MNKGQKAGNEPIVVDAVKGKNYVWCVCKQTNNQPFCDGSHSK